MSVTYNDKNMQIVNREKVNLVDQQVNAQNRDTAVKPPVEPMQDFGKSTNSGSGPLAANIFELEHGSGRSRPAIQARTWRLVQ